MNAILPYLVISLPYETYLYWHEIPDHRNHKKSRASADCLNLRKNNFFVEKRQFYYLTPIQYIINKYISE